MESRVTSHKKTPLTPQFPLIYDCQLAPVAVWALDLWDIAKIRSFVLPLCFRFVFVFAVRLVPKQLPYYTNSPWCDHCNWAKQRNTKALNLAKLLVLTPGRFNLPQKAVGGHPKYHLQRTGPCWAVLSQAGPVFHWNALSHSLSPLAVCWLLLWCKCERTYKYILVKIHQKWKWRCVLRSFKFDVRLPQVYTCLFLWSSVENCVKNFSVSLPGKENEKLFVNLRTSRQFVLKCFTFLCRCQRQRLMRWAGGSINCTITRRAGWQEAIPAE